MTGPKKAIPTAGAAPVFLISLDARTGRPLHRQVYDGLREAILLGRLVPGARVPSTRTLAAELGVARNTVTLAFDQLRAEGYLIGRRGGGTRVRGVVPDALLHVRSGGAGGLALRGSRPAVERARANRHAPAADLSVRGAALVTAGTRLALRAGTPPVAFRLGVPALELFPAALWARLTARRWRQGGIQLGNADPGGEPVLREAIAAYLINARGARCTAEQVFVVNGTQQALDLIARVLTDPGDVAWVEDPGYTGARVALAASGIRLVPVPVDADGLDVSAGERAAPAARLAYVTPSHQFPLGAVMSAPRRLALLAWARRARAWVVEDDYDSEFRYAGRPLLCLQGLDAEQRGADESARVLYVGTFSKTLIPGLRLGYLVVPDALVDAFRATRAALDRHASTIAQGVLADFIIEGHYARHLRRARTLYAERQATLLAEAESLGERLTLAPDVAGLHLVGWLPPGVSDIAVAVAGLREGVEMAALSRNTIGVGVGRGAVLLNYAGYEGRVIRRGIGRLRRALDLVRGTHVT